MAQAHNNKSMRVMVMAGGTGGHVFPALAVAKELQRRGHQIRWLGTARGLESEVIPREGIDIDFVPIRGLRGNGVLGWLLAPFKISNALLKVLAAIKRYDPAVVLGMGGFVTGPGGVAARLLGIPLIIHEQNAIAGMTNTLLSKIATRVCEAFPNTFAGKKVFHTGNPVRADILAGETTSKPHGDVIHVLVVGGSLGAKALNEVVPETLSKLPSDKKLRVRQQTGKKLYQETVEIYAKYHVKDAEVMAFIDDMAAAYQWADIVICRSGALTVAELAAVGLPSVLVPYPFAVDDHQTANAEYLSNGGAAFVIQQSELNADRLLQTLLKMDATMIQKMGEAAKKLALPDATRVVADHCVEIANV